MKQLLAIVLLAGIALANNGEGTPVFCERHGCGLPENQEHPCDTQPTACPDPAPCPEVTCEATDCSKTTVIVECPKPDLDGIVFPNYLKARRNADGTIVTPPPGSHRPRRLLVPEAK